jgi:hypothetical protein
MVSEDEQKTHSSFNAKTLSWRAFEAQGAKVQKVSMTGGTGGNEKSLIPETFTVGVGAEPRWLVTLP